MLNSPAIVQASIINAAGVVPGCEAKDSSKLEIQLSKLGIFMVTFHFWRFWNVELQQGESGQYEVHSGLLLKSEASFEKSHETKVLVQEHLQKASRTSHQHQHAGCA